MLLLLGAAPQAYAQQTGTVATVDSRLFPTEILEYKKRIEQLNQEFQDRTREVQKLAADLRSYEIDLNTNRLNYTEPIRRERGEQLERMRRLYNRKSEDLESDLKKRAEALVGPIKDKITKALTDFAQSHGLSIVYDLATAAERGGLVYASPSVDITDAFVESYNRANTK